MHPLFRIAAFAAALAILIGNAAGTLAHDQGTPVPSSAGAFSLDPRLEDYPELHIRISDTAIDVPATVVAGRTLVIQENTTSVEAHFFIARIPDHITAEQLDADLVVAAETVPMTTPDWLFQSLFVGNPDYAPMNGGQAAAVVDLVPGRYVIIDPFRPDIPGRFEVVADSSTPVAVVTPEADAQVELFEMNFRLPDEIRSGRQIWEITNAGAAFHEISLIPVPDGATTDEAVTALQSTLTGESIEGQVGPAWDGWQYVTTNGAGVLSPGGTLWAQFDIEPGTYAVACFVPGANGPHLMDGMIQIVTVL
jgi:hypothetical protein